jgi:hypothetical protein
LTLIASNIFLTLENRSFYYSIFTTIRYKNNLVLPTGFDVVNPIENIVEIKPVEVVSKAPLNEEKKINKVIYFLTMLPKPTLPPCSPSPSSGQVS